MGRILAIDYGLKRSGLAWTDVHKSIALPLEGLPTDQLWERLHVLLPEVERVIVGYPRHLNGRATEMTTPVEQFLIEFQRRFPHLPIEKVEERLSTKAASHYIGVLPRAKRRDKATVDCIAASILLENYLLRKQR
ncbi:MAG: Holliday junction resolvase RuvX [Bacteroidia bacterium]|nr:Holliday junction resolvase RuvX [Bacteroidia bacterium]